MTRNGARLGVPTVSVCIPAFNGASYIRDSVDSVLKQTFEDFELVVVDDASTDSTVAIVSDVDDPRVRLVRSESTVGLGANWNRALDEARGRFIKVMAQDDLIFPECLEHQVQALKEYPRAVLTSVKRDIIDGNGSIVKRGHGLRRLGGYVRGEDALRRIARSGANPLGEGAAVLLDREAVREVGYFDGSYPFVIDIDYWTRLLEGRAMVGIPEALAAFRVSAGSLSVHMATRQRLQVREFVRRLRSRHPGCVTRGDVAVGMVNATWKGFARQALYLGIRARMRKASEE